MDNNNNIILKGVGGFYTIHTPFGLVTAKPRGIFREKGEKPVAGDFVLLETADEGEGFTHVITEILPRKNRLVRPPVANVDRLLIVASTVEPKSSPMIIDTMIAAGVFLDAKVSLIITKTDLKEAKRLIDIYENTPHKPLISGKDDDEISLLASGGLSVLAGNTGAGKSTLMNRLYGVNRPTAPISKKLGRGVHTTREAELIPTENGGFLADTAGFSSLSFSMLCDAKQSELDSLFLEFREYKERCRFADCSHRAEEGCDVLRAVEEKKIHQSRYNSYLKLYEEIKRSY